MTAAPATLVLERLTKTFRSPESREVIAVDDVSLEFRGGSFVTLLGPSGCGKTTTLRMIAGFETPTTGRILLDGADVSRRTPDKREMGMVFQSYALFPHLTVFENVAYGLRLRRTSGAALTDAVERTLALVNLHNLGRRRPSELSGGQQQRVALARAMAIEPRVLLFDEPLSNLDAQLRTQMRIEIRQLQQSLGLTAIYVTHDQEEALAISDRVAVLRGGRIEQVDAPEAIYRTPRTAFVAEFLGATNMLPGVTGQFDGRDTIVAAAGTELRVRGEVGPRGGSVLLSIRPEALRLADGSDGPRIPVRLVLREFLGPLQRLHATLPDGTPIRISALGGQEAKTDAGGMLNVVYDPGQILAFPAS
ncbi:MAG: ABC transporter ATP-binding protein [Candidatus Limnocylindria bacterium]